MGGRWRVFSRRATVTEDGCTGILGHNLIGHILSYSCKLEHRTAHFSHITRPMTSVFNFTFVPWFRSVAPYIHKFRNQTFVVAMAGEAIAAGKLPHLAQDLAMI
jgi:hypothetical protein